MKKILLGLGAITISIVPIVSTVACGDMTKGTKKTTDFTNNINENKIEENNKNNEIEKIAEETLDKTRTLFLENNSDLTKTQIQQINDAKSMTEYTKILKLILDEINVHELEVTIHESIKSSTSLNDFTDLLKNCKILTAKDFLKDQSMCKFNSAPFGLYPYAPETKDFKNNGITDPIVITMNEIIDSLKNAEISETHVKDGKVFIISHGGVIGSNGGQFSDADSFEDLFNFCDGVSFQDIKDLKDDFLARFPEIDFDIPLNSLFIYVHDQVNRDGVEIKATIYKLQTMWWEKDSNRIIKRPYYQAVGYLK